MSDGLITRVGKWIDSKFDEKATVNYVNQVEMHLMDMDLKLAAKIITIEASIATTDDLKKRLEQLELYVGMKRKVDPLKDAVAKSAFSM